MKNLFTTSRFLHTLCLTALLSLGSISILANDYQYSGSDNGWTGENMTVSTGGYYEYRQCSGGTYFDIIRKSPWASFGSSYIVPGFNGTNITTFSGSGSCHVSSAPASYYVIVWLPGTPFNSGSDPVICASTTLPDDTSLPSCTAPTSVSVTGAWDYFGGETISLTATPTGGSGTPSYQWQKLINSTWENLTDGDDSGATYSGVTTDNLQIANCGFGNSGKYRCVVSTGASCSTASATATDGTQGFGIKVFALECYTGGTTVYNFTRVGSSQAGTLTINLDANTTYQFKVHADNDYYGNNGTISMDATNWVCSTDEGNLQIQSGMGGTFTISMDYSTGGNNSTEGIPELSVTYPRKTFYLELCSDWKAAAAKYEIYYWKGGTSGWSGFMDTYACNGDVRYAEVPAWATNCIFVRFNSSKSTPGSWDNEWNRTGDLNLSASTDYYQALSRNDDDYKYYGSWGTFTPTTYTITFNGNGGAGSMANMVVNCAEDATLPSNAFTKTGYLFTGWYANVAVTINNSSVAAGTLIANGATLQNVSSDITLTAQWEEITTATIPGTVDKDNVTDYIASMTWYGANDEYFDFGPTAAANLDRWAEWDVQLLYSDRYIVSVIVDFPASPDGYQWKLQLLDGGGNEVATAYQSIQIWGVQEYTYSEKWDLRGVTPGSYKLRVTNIFGWAQPKLKSVTFTAAGLSFTYTKTPDEDPYGKAGDSYRAYGTINDAVVPVSGIPMGAIVSVSNNVLTIGSVTITAPLTETGRLDDIPIDTDPGHTAASCTWRFDHWENVPATMTSDVDDVVAVYFPTFDVEYETFDGVIHDDPYYLWYRYTGRSEDYTPLPVDVTKEGFVFGGWYQVETTELFTRMPGNYYGGFTGVWCLKAHWLLPCDEPQLISKVVLTGTSSYETDGYDDKEYVGVPIISVSATTVVDDVDGDGNMETGYELGAAGDHFFLTVVDGFRVGDTVCVAITRQNTVGRISSSPNYLDLFYRSTSGSITKLTHMKDVVTGPGIYKYVLSADDVDAMADADAPSVGVYRLGDATGQNPCVYSIEVRGCRDLIFDNHDGDFLWSNPLNWAPNYTEIPSYHQAARILTPCIVDIANAQARNAKLCKGNGHNGSFTINANAALSVVQRVSTVQGSDYNTLLAVAAEDLVILSNASNQGALIHSDTGGNTHATVQFYGRGAGAPNWATATWQYMGTPFTDVPKAIDHYMNSWMCQWVENTAGNAGTNWSWIENEDPVQPWVGYALTQAAPITFTNTGTLVPSSEQTFSLTCGGTTGYTGWNMIANSWMAPINIAAFQASDFGDAQATIYIFNTGINEGDQASCPESNTAGQYVAVPYATAPSMLEGNKHVAPMQAFFIVTESPTTVTLNYDRLVRDPLHGAISVLPNRAPKRNAQEENSESLMPRIIIDVDGQRFSDRLYLFENTEQTNGFDNGWDGYKFEGESYAPQLMTRTGEMDLAVDVSPAFGGKRIAFRCGEDNQYTLRFSTTEPGLRLRDLLTGSETDIVEGATYDFFAYNTETEERFEIIDRRDIIETPTGLDELLGTDISEIIELTVYTADGRLVLHRNNNFGAPLRLPQSGVYIVQLRTTTGSIIQKITL